MMQNYFQGAAFPERHYLVAVGYYFRFSLSYRDIVEILCDRGITVQHTTIMRWVGHYLNYYGGNSDAHIARVGESLKLTSKSTVDSIFYRAIGSHGLTLDYDLRKHRNYQSAYHFLRRLLTIYG